METPKPIVEKVRDYAGPRGRINKYDVVCPVGYHFADGPHVLRAWDIKEVRKFMEYPLTKCAAECDCGWDMEE